MRNWWIGRSDVPRYGAVEDLGYVIGQALPKVVGGDLTGHQSTRLHVVSPGIDRRQAVFLDQLDNQLSRREKVAYVADQKSVWWIMRDFGKRALNLGPGSTPGAATSRRFR